MIFSGLFKFNFFLGDDRVGVNILSKRTVFFGDFVGVLKNTGSGAAVNKNKYKINSYQIFKALKICC